MRVVTLAFLRYLPRRRSLTLLQVLGVGCGVAAVVGMSLSAGTALKSFERAVDFLRGGATHSLRRSAGPMDEDVVAEVARDGSVRALSPVVEGWVRLGGGETVRLLGVDPFLDGKLRTAVYENLGELHGQDLLEDLVLAEGAVLAGDNLAVSLGLSRGDDLVTTAGTLRLAGIFRNPPGEPLLLMDIAQAQELLRKRGVVDRVELVLDDPEGFVSRWAKGFAVQSAGEQRGGLEGMLRAFRLNLQALSLTALFVGVFLVYNTSMFAVLSRRRDAGILRSLGATRGETAMAFLIEVSLLGACGGALGSLLGYLLGTALTGVVGSTISDLYFSLAPEPARWSWAYAAAGVLLGWGSALSGAAWPLLELMRTEPVRALQGRTASPAPVTKAASAAMAGTLLMAGALATALPEKMGVYGGFAAAFAFLAGASLMSGAAVASCAPLLGEVFGALAGVTGRLAAGVLSRNLGRTAVAAAAFMVALSLTIGLGSMIGSFRSSLQRWMEGQLTGEIYIGSSPEVTIPAEVYEEISALDGVAGVDRYRNEGGLYEGKAIRIAAVDASVLQAHTHFWWQEGGEENWDPVKQGAVIVSESFARRFGKAKGGKVVLEGKNGPEEFTVAAVFHDYTTEHGLIMMDRATYLRVFEDRAVDSLGVFLEKGRTQRDDLLAGIAAVAAKGGLPFWTRRDFFDRILSVFDSTFAVTRSMRVIAVLVALLGIAGALMTLFLERRREFGIYRALGFSVAEVSSMVLMEGVGLGIVSFLLAVPAGTVLSLILIRVINLRSFNWTIFYEFSWEPYLVAAATALAAGLLASLYPSLKLFRVWPSMQLREE